MANDVALLVLDRPSTKQPVKLVPYAGEGCGALHCPARWVVIMCVCVLGWARVGGAASDAIAWQPGGTSQKLNGGLKPDTKKLADWRHLGLARRVTPISTLRCCHARLVAPPHATLTPHACPMLMKPAFPLGACLQPSRRCQCRRTRSSLPSVGVGPSLMWARKATTWRKNCKR